MNGNREYKSDVFSMLMEDAANALEVYNALNGSEYADPEEVEMVRLEKGVSLSVRNDASFLVGMHVSFYEHQSSYNPNMPLRSLIYFVSALEEWLKEKDLYGRKRIAIPTPHFVVFYNGTEERPEYEEMRLSEAFFHRTDEPEIEVKCKVYNINPRYNRELKERSAVLAGYTYFVEKVRTNREDGIPLEEAIDGAIRDCIKGHILEEFFEKRKDEVKKMTQLDYTWERREQLIRKEEYEEGLNDGMERGMERGLERGKRDMAVGMFKLMLPVEQIAQAAGESLATVERWIGELKQPADEGLHIG